MWHYIGVIEMGAIFWLSRYSKWLLSTHALDACLRVCLCPAGGVIAKKTKEKKGKRIIGTKRKLSPGRLSILTIKLGLVTVLGKKDKLHLWLYGGLKPLHYS